MDRNRQTISGRPAFSGIPRPGFSSTSSGLQRQSSFGRDGYSAGAKARPNVASSGYGQYGQRQTVAPGSAGSRVSMYGRPSTHSLQPGWSAAKNLMSSARKSYASRGQGRGLFGSMTPQTNRPSMNAGTASSRRSSLGGAARKLQMDPKFLEPEVQKQSMRRINDFLTSNGLPKLNPSFSTTEVKNLFKELLGELGLLMEPVENRQTIGLKKQLPKASNEKWADDIITFLPRLGYPYQIQKSNLTSFASGFRAKAPIIASLEWVVDILRYQMNLDPEKIMFVRFDNDFDVDPAMKQNSIDRKLLEMAISLNPEDPRFSEEKTREFEKLAHSQYADETQLDQLREECDKLEEDIALKVEEIKEYNDLPGAIDVYKRDNIQYETYIKEMQERIESVESVIKQIEEEISSKQTLLEKMKQEEINLKNLVKTQMTDIDQIEMARERQKQLEDDIKSEQTIIEKKKNEKMKAASQLAMVVGSLKRMQEDAINLFDQVSDGISMKATAQYLKPLIEFVNSNETQSLIQSLKFRPDPETGTGLDEKSKRIRQKFVEMANYIKSELKKQSTAIDGEFKTKDDQLLEEIERTIDEQTNRIQELKTLVDQLRTELSQQRSKDQHEIDTLKSEYESNKKFLSQLDSKMKQSLEEVAQRVDKLSKQLDESIKASNTHKKEQLAKFKAWTEKQKMVAVEISKKLAAKAAEVKAIKENLDSALKTQGPKVDSLRDKIENYINAEGEKREKKRGKK